MRILSVVGNRPQFIKSAPLSVALREAGIDEVVVHTGQHYDRELSQVFFDELGLAEPALPARPAHRRPRRDAAGDRATRVAAERPDWVLVFGDTNSTLAGAARRPRPACPLAHVEAGLRSGDLAMPEERNRIEVDRARRAAALPRRALARDTLEREGVAGRIEVVGDVMADACVRLAPIARERSDALARLGRRARRLRRRHDPPRGERAPGRASRRIVDGPEPRSTSPVVFPAHPRTRARARGDGSGSARTCASLEPLGYLDFAALASQARVIVTDSGGLQKEAYWYGVPCVTRGPRPSGSTRSSRARTCSSTTTPTRSPRPSRRARCPTTRPPLYGDGHASRADRGGLLCTLPAPMSAQTETERAAARSAHVDVAIVGAGYVGVPLAQVFADAGRSRAARRRRRRARRDAEPRRELHRGRPVGASSRRLVESGAARDHATTTSCASADAILIALPTPLSKQREPDLSIVEARVARDRAAPPRRATSSCSSRRRTRARRARSSSRCSSAAAGLKAGEDFHLAFSPERVDPGRDATGRRRTSPKIVGGITPALHRGAPPSSTAARSTPCTASPRPRRPS